MKFLALLALLFQARAQNRPRNANLRAGQYPEPMRFSPWKVLVS